MLSERRLGYLNLSLQIGKNFKTNMGHELAADLGVPGCIGVLFVFESEQACEKFIPGPFLKITCKEGE